jgi:hypothetical protein
MHSTERKPTNFKDFGKKISTLVGLLLCRGTLAAAIHKKFKKKSSIQIISTISTNCMSKLLTSKLFIALT